MSASEDAPIEIDHFSDVLCIWAYLGQARVDELARKFGERIRITTRFCSVFSDTHAKFAVGWKDRHGFEGYARHIRMVCRDFPHVTLNPDAWAETRPASSAPMHLFLKAVELVEEEDAGCATTAIPYLERLTTKAAWALRLAFFSEARDIADWSVQAEVAAGLGIDPERPHAPEVLTRAVAALAQDMDRTRTQGVEGSPTIILNSGRQKLFGNVGYRLLEANVEELLNRPAPDAVSWC